MAKYWTILTICPLQAYFDQSRAELPGTAYLQSQSGDNNGKNYLSYKKSA